MVQQNENDGDPWSSSLPSAEDARLEAAAARRELHAGVGTEEHDTTPRGFQYCAMSKRCYFAFVALLVVSLVVMVAVAVSKQSGESPVEMFMDVFGHGKVATASSDPEKGDIILTSSAFSDMGTIPKQYTADGANESPPLSWSEVPKGAKSLVLICDDPDAPAMDEWNHWVAYDIPPVLSGLEQGVLPLATESVYSDAELESVEFHQGPNSWGDGSFGWKGPDPPKGSGMHRYVFRIFAMKSMLELEPDSASKDEVVFAMKKLGVLGFGTLIGTYER